MVLEMLVAYRHLMQLIAQEDFIELYYIVQVLKYEDPHLIFKVKCVMVINIRALYVLLMCDCVLSSVKSMICFFILVPMLSRKWTK